MFQAVHNLTEQPIVLDAEGHLLGGGEWGVADPANEATKAALDAGTLAGYPAGSILDGPGQNPDAVTASKAAQEANATPVPSVAAKAAVPVPEPAAQATTPPPVSEAS